MPAPLFQFQCSPPVTAPKPERIWPNEEEIAKYQLNDSLREWLLRWEANHFEKLKDQHTATLRSVEMLLEIQGDKTITRLESLGHIRPLPAHPPAPRSDEPAHHPA